MREKMPDLALRTTFIVGYPGETETEFQTLLDFIQEIQFDHIGAFPYFQEPGTSAEILGDPVSQLVKDKRIEQLMSIQQNISLSRNQSLVGKELQVLIEGCNEGISVGRSYRDAPEIDGMVFVEGSLAVGDIHTIQITDAMTHDLVGIPKK